MKISFSVFALPFIVASSCLALETMGSIERLSPELDELISPEAKIEVLAEGFKWAEGPVWDRENERLLFSDVPNNVIHSWSEKDGLKIFMPNSGYSGEGRGSNGLAYDASGQLLICEHGNRRISRLLPSGEKETFVSKYQDKKLNSPNDLVLHPKGWLFFTDPPYGLPKKDKDAAKELEVNGVYRVDTDQSVHLLVKDLVRPNGVALSPDAQILYVAQSEKGKAIIMAYQLDAKGEVVSGKVFFDANPLAKKDPGMPDGLKVDEGGNVWATGPGGVLILSPEGELLGRILPGKRTANCGWGDDGKTLYLTSHTHLLRVKTLSKGLVY